MRVNDGFDFSRVNVFSARDDHVLQAIENVEVPVGVLITNVAGSEKAVPEREFSFFRLVPITAHDIRATCDQLARLPGFNFLSCWIDDAHVDSEARTPARGEFVFSVLIVFQAGQEPGLTQPIDLNEFNIWQNLSRAMHEFGSHWRSAISQMPKSREVILLQLRRLRQHIDHRRHQHRVSDPFALNGLAEGLRIELWNSDLTGAESRRGEHERKIRDVKNRRGMQMHRTILKREPEVGVIDVLQNICMPDLDAFRPARCAAGVDKRQNGVWMVNWIRNGVALSVERILIKHQLP